MEMYAHFHVLYVDDAYVAHTHAILERYTHLLNCIQGQGESV